MYVACSTLNVVKNNLLKSRLFWFQGCSRSSMLILLDRLLAVLVMMSSKVVLICNRFHARLVDCSRNCAFWRGIQTWGPFVENSLNLGGRSFHCWNLRLMQKNSFTGCFGLSPAILAQFTFELCVVSQNREKFTKPHYFWSLGSLSHRCRYIRKAGQQCLLR